MTAKLPPLEQLALDVSDLLHQVQVNLDDNVSPGWSSRTRTLTVTEVTHERPAPTLLGYAVDEDGQLRRDDNGDLVPVYGRTLVPQEQCRTVTEIPAGLLRLTSDPDMHGTRQPLEGEGRPSGFGSRPPVRTDLLAIPQMILHDGLELLVKYAPDARLPRTPADMLHALSAAALAGDTDCQQDIASSVQSIADRARIGLGLMAGPVECATRCLWCRERLIAPSPRPGEPQELRCRNERCRCDMADCPCGRRKTWRHRWLPDEVGLLLAQNAKWRAEDEAAAEAAQGEAVDDVVVDLPAPAVDVPAVLSGLIPDDVWDAA